MRREIHIRKVFNRSPELERFCSLVGKNNLFPRLPERYLYLRSYGASYRDGKWTCDIYFTPLPKLELESQPVDDAVNWRAWLGDSWEIAS